MPNLADGFARLSLPLHAHSRKDCAARRASKRRREGREVTDAEVSPELDEPTEPTSVLLRQV